ncbi:MAG: TrkA family potassium uptake protein [Flexistipes sinusarabici]|uniref:TrkA family potassium uptake protein n=1 Tax=Flexistipes sinusarabici TaxID=2352 RepID=A0A5D0MLT5_FLESI|nr:TrkA family potassium uptake protein [Flexistipes sinusarabici]TYB33956.1 MAG: TrkA family potassium uptake protein [Flexistipes sinusarabici]
MSEKNYAVIGLGIFGYRLAVELFELGNNILAVDRNRKLVEQIKEKVTEAVVADASDYDALEELKIQDFKTVIVGMSDNLEQLILCVTNLKKLGVERIIAKANRKIHEEILLKIGADEVVLAEREMAERLAHRISRPDILKIIDVDSEVKLVNVKLGKKFAGKTLKNLKLREKYNINAILLKHKDNPIKLITDPDIRFQEDDELYVAGSEEDIYKIF